jgi:hypothetical protein
MTKKQRIQFWHKKQEHCAGPASQARHASVKDGRLVPNFGQSLTGAQEFIKSLKAEIKKAVQ